MNIPYMDPVGKDKLPSELYPMSHKLSSKNAGFSRRNLPTRKISGWYSIIRFTQIGTAQITQTKKNSSQKMFPTPTPQTTKKYWKIESQARSLFAKCREFSSLAFFGCQDWINWPSGNKRWLASIGSSWWLGLGNSSKNPEFPSWHGVHGD